MVKSEQMNESRRLTGEELILTAMELTSLANQIKIIERLINSVEYARVSGDTFVVQHQIDSGLLNEIGDSLSQIENAVQKISDGIYPE